MMVDFGAEMTKPRSSAHSSIFDAWAKGFSHHSNVGVGTVNSKVISVGVGEKVF